MSKRLIIDANDQSECPDVALHRLNLSKLKKNTPSSALAGVLVVKPNTAADSKYKLYKVTLYPPRNEKEHEKEEFKEKIQRIWTGSNS